MTDEINKVVAAVAAPKTSRTYKQREAIYETKFSFTDKNMVRVKYRKLSHDRRYDEKIPGLSIEVYPKHITFFVFKNINMYNKKKNTWAPNVVYKKMFVWAKNTGKKYLTKITPKQQKFIDIYVSGYGELTAKECAIRAGYESGSAPDACINVKYSRYSLAK